MGCADEGASRGLVDTPGLDPDEAVLDDVDAADAISTRDFVGEEENLEGGGGGDGAHGQPDGEALLELPGILAVGVLEAVAV